VPLSPPFDFALFLSPEEGLLIFLFEPLEDSVRFVEALHRCIELLLRLCPSSLGSFAGRVDALLHGELLGAVRAALLPDLLQVVVDVVHEWQCIPHLALIPLRSRYAYENTVNRVLYNA